MKCLLTFLTLLCSSCASWTAPCPQNPDCHMRSAEEMVTNPAPPLSPGEIAMSYLLVGVAYALRPFVSTDFEAALLTATAETYPTMRATRAMLDAQGRAMAEFKAANPDRDIDIDALERQAIATTLQLADEAEKRGDHEAALELRARAKRLKEQEPHNE